MLIGKWSVKVLAALAAGLIACLGVSCSREVPLEKLVGNNAEVVEAIRGGLVRNSSCLTISFHSSEDIRRRLMDLSDLWIKEAMAETDRPNEGDYIRYQYGGYESSYTCSHGGDGWNYVLRITPRYYSYHEYEEIVTEKVREIIDSFGFTDDSTDYEKIRAVYDYVCSNVDYDRIHVKNENYYLRSTAYAALVWGSATCQGYCVALYRLLREAGINTRIVTGTADGEQDGALHAWNIIELAGTYYFADATWDAGRDEYEYFLRGSGDLTDRRMDDRFLTREFAAEYPINTESYIEREEYP